MEQSQINRLLCRVAAGDEQAFETLYIQTRNGIFSFLYSYLPNYHDCEDAMQDVYLKIRQGIGTYRQGTNGSAWMLQIAKNHALNILQARKRHPGVELDQLTVAAEDTTVLRLTVLEAMRRALSGEEQRIVTMHVLWGYKHRQIAQMLDCPTGTVTSKYKRAMDKLRAALKEVDG